MGELRGGRPDVPREPDKPAPDRARTPANSNNDPRALSRAWRQAEHPAFAAPRVEVRYVTDRRPDTTPAGLRPYRTSKDRPEPEPKPDGPTHRAPDIEPPSGKELVEKDAPGAKRLDRARKKFFEAENLDDEQSVIHDWGDLFQGTVLEKPQAPPSIKCESRPPHAVSETPQHGIETGDTLTAMFFAGILLGESIRTVYRKASESKEKLHARYG